jgi:hypothetical protein
MTASERAGAVLSAVLGVADILLSSLNAGAAWPSRVLGVVLGLLTLVGVLLMRRGRHRAG